MIMYPAGLDGVGSGLWVCGISHNPTGRARWAGWALGLCLWFVRKAPGQPERVLGGKRAVWVLALREKGTGRAGW